MDKRPIEPGLIRIFRYFTGVAMLYFAVLIIYTAIETGEGFTASQIQSYMNFGTNLVLFGYLSWEWLRRRLRYWYLPIGLITATVVPIFSNLIYLTEPRSKDLALIITSSWLLLPILLVPLVLIAWQYRFRYVILFILFTTLVELSVLLPVVHRIDFETLPILGVPFIRAFAFGTVGHIVVHLIDTQRAQRRELVRANIRLSKHAQTLEQLTVIRERNRLARELHDTLAHTLSGQAVNLEAIKTMIPPERTDIHEMLDHSLNNIRAGLAETRRALKALRSATLEDFGLAISIRNLATDAATRGDLRLNLAIDENIPDLTPDVEQCFYRIAQESLENTIRHAHASAVTLQLVRQEDVLRMVIQDNGEGFDLREAELDDKLGIQGMQERAEMVHGKLTFNSAPGKGTNIELIVGVGDD
ncbi:MAG TPA: sensor histidine kinase [Anaerolineae bacterium]|nr:sensor histidine kinase [Anaerolineae bacterium]